MVTFVSAAETSYEASGCETCIYCGCVGCRHVSEHGMSGLGGLLRWPAL